MNTRKTPAQIDREQTKLAKEIENASVFDDRFEGLIRRRNELNIQAEHNASPVEYQHCAVSIPDRVKL